MIRIHKVEDPVREDMADRLAAALWDIQRLLFGTLYTFDVTEICDRYGIILGEAA